MGRTYGSYMIQPTKDQYRRWLREAQSELKQERRLHQVAEWKLGVATRKLGALVLEGKITIPAEKLGELVLQIAGEEEAAAETEKVLAQV
jgi:hypothetical protein